MNYGPRGTFSTSAGCQNPCPNPDIALGHVSQLDQCFKPRGGHQEVMRQPFLLGREHKSGVLGLILPLGGRASALGWQAASRGAQSGPPHEKPGLTRKEEIWPVYPCPVPRAARGPGCTWLDPGPGADHRPASDPGTMSAR